MFGNHRKTIGVFINRSEMEFQKVLIQGIVSEALKYGFNIAFMDSYGIRESKNMYDYYESAIVHFAPIEEFDAIIVALDTYDTPILRDKLIEALQIRAKCPVISFREENNSFYSVTTEANKAVEQLVKHFVEEHHVKRFGFMAGYDGHVDSEARLDFFTKELKSRGISLADNAVFYGDMWKYKGEDAYRFFFEGEGIKPEGIICANDYMARALCDALQRHGIKIPEDVCVSGFDNVKEAYSAVPGLTTVGVDYETMAREAVRLVDSLLKGEKRSRRIAVPVYIRLRNSCCHNVDSSNDMLEKNYYSSQMDNFTERHNWHMYFAIDMDGCTSYEEMYRIIENNLELLGEYKEFYLCFFENRDEDGNLVFHSDITEYAMLKLVNHDGRRLQEKDILFRQKELLPSEFVTEEPFIGHFTLLHNRSKCFGYTVVCYRNPAEVFDAFFHNWNLTVSLTINEISTKERLMYLSRQNEENSMTDYLTGLWNRRGLEKMVYGRWDEWCHKREQVLFLSIDMDKLKSINDTFGHKEGDRAICVAANAIRYALENRGIAARTGGDEFEVVIQTEQEDAEEVFCKLIEERLRLDNSQNTQYQVSMSIGSYRKVLDIEDEYEECIKKSDAEMYRHKMRKKEKKD